MYFWDAEWGVSMQLTGHSGFYDNYFISDSPSQPPHIQINLNRGTTGNMATVAVKEGEVGPRCLSESNHWDPNSRNHLWYRRRASDLLRERLWRKFLKHRCVPWPLSIRLEACSECSCCCSGGCHTPLIFTCSFLRKGKKKPKPISPEVILCQGTPDIFAALVYS